MISLMDIGMSPFLASNKRQSRLFERFAALRARALSPMADNAHTCGLSGVFPDAHVTGENEI